jgi:phospholipase C
MGYYTRNDIPIHYLLADAFTVCDQYFCSVMGSTLANRLYWLSATLDPDGVAGGPVLTSPFTAPIQKFSWRIMPQNLGDAGVSWKVYRNKQLEPFLSVYGPFVSYFKQAADPTSELARRGIAPSYPANFVADVLADNLPQVSRVIPNILASEHPAFPAAVGASAIVTLLRILLSNPAVWEKMALIVCYDENGGFFDQVVPPTPPATTPGEYLTVTDINAVPGANGIRGPIGLGFRVPCLVISPYSRGGLMLMVHDSLDHTSQLRLLETRFGVPVPNLTAWRGGVTGDMTSASNFAAPPNPSRPKLDHPLLGALSKMPQCAPNVLLGNLQLSIPYRVPYPQTMPSQETTPTRGIPSASAERLSRVDRVVAHDDVRPPHGVPIGIAAFVTRQHARRRQRHRGTAHPGRRGGTA